MVKRLPPRLEVCGNPGKDNPLARLGGDVAFLSIPTGNLFFPLAFYRYKVLRAEATPEIERQLKKHGIEYQKETVAAPEKADPDKPQPPSVDNSEKTATRAKPYSLTGTFLGTVHNLTADLQANFGIFVQENQNTISGCMAVRKPLYGSGPLFGAVNSALVHFDVPGPPWIHFDGELSGNRISGTYRVQSPGGTIQNGEFILVERTPNRYREISTRRKTVPPIQTSIASRSPRAAQSLMRQAPEHMMRSCEPTRQTVISPRWSSLRCPSTPLPEQKPSGVFCPSLRSGPRVYGNSRGIAHPCRSFLKQSHPLFFASGASQVLAGPDLPPVEEPLHRHFERPCHLLPAFLLWEPCGRSPRARCSSAADLSAFRYRLVIGSFFRATLANGLMAAGADLARIRFAKMSSETPHAAPQEREMRLDIDIAAIKKALVENPNVRLIIIDPVSNYLGQTKMVDEQSVRRVLTPLQNLAAETGVAIVGIMHLNKKQDLSVISRIGGAMAFVGVARAVWLFAADEGAPNTFHMLRVKNNIADRGTAGLLYRIATRSIEIEGEGVPEPYVEWIG
ncbi:MAG: AAA family ATPase, partial [Candidatus Micrarchaeaceae archaeon]